VHNDDAALCEPVAAAHVDVEPEYAEPELPLAFDDVPEDEEPVQASLF